MNDTPILLVFAMSDPAASQCPAGGDKKKTADEMRSEARPAKAATQEENFPAVQGGGSLILAWQIRNKRVLVVGGGEVRKPPARIELN